MKFRTAATAKNLAYIAVMTALLIGGQFALSFASGVEVVTVLLLCFSAYFGVVTGVATAVCFCTLRCFIWGFMPNVVLLYFIYYPLFAAFFGLLGKIDSRTFDCAKVRLSVAVNALLISISATALCLALFEAIKISRLYKAAVQALLYAVAGIGGALIIAFNVFYILVRRRILKNGKPLKIFLFTAVAAVCTGCFTLLDDVISPLIVGMDNLTALTYFYGSFLAMLPQVICTVATVSTLYFPLTLALTKACPKSKLY